MFRKAGSACERSSVDVFLIRAPDASEAGFVMLPGLEVLVGHTSDYAALFRARVVAVLGSDAWARGTIAGLRLRGVCAPILALRDSKDARGGVDLLNAGADSCLPSDCAPEEAVAVVGALLRRGPLRLADSRIEVALDDSARTLSLYGKPFKFGPVAFSVVRYLVGNAGRWVSQRELIERAIGTFYRPDSAVARVQIHQIRKVLGQYRDCIRQDGNRGCGYMFTSDGLQAACYRAAQEPKAPSASVRCLDAVVGAEASTVPVN